NVNNSRYSLAGVVVPAGGSVTLCQTDQTCAHQVLSAGGTWNDGGDTLFVMNGATAVVSEAYTSGDTSVSSSFDVVTPDPALTNVDAYYTVGTGYTAISVDFTTENVTDATGVELRVNRSDSTTYSITAQQSVIDLINNNPTQTLTG